MQLRIAVVVRTHECSCTPLVRFCDPWPMELDRGTEWDQARKAFQQLTAELRVPPTTAQITVIPQEIPEANAVQLGLAVSADPRWAGVLRHKASGAYHFYMYQVRTPADPGRIGDILWLDPHSHIGAWLVINAWRVRQLSDQAAESFTGYELLVAGVLTRSLVEAAAALSSDVERLATAWSACRTNVPSPEQPVSPEYTALNNLAVEFLAGGKFKTDDIKPLSDRRNVLTAVERLGKRGIANLAVEYDWLCNLAHPSFAATFAFAGPVMMRKTDSWVQYGERPLEAFPDSDQIDRTILNVIRSAATQSLRLFTVEFDRAVRLLDDIGLTTQAPRLAATDYWRRLVVGGRNDRCPCRSGRKVKVCRHEWGSPYVEQGEATDT